MSEEEISNHPEKYSKVGSYLNKFFEKHGADVACEDADESLLTAIRCLENVLTDLDKIRTTQQVNVIRARRDVIFAEYIIAKTMSKEDEE